MPSVLQRLVPAIVLGSLLGVLMAVLAYALLCLVFVAKQAALLGRVPLAVRNLAIALLVLIVAIRVSRGLAARIGRRWLWLPVLALASSITVFSVMYYMIFYGVQAGGLSAETLAQSLKSQKGQRLRLPSDFSGYVIPTSSYEEIIPNDRWVGLLFGLHLSQPEEVYVELTPDFVIKEVRVGNL
jgi:hypothetical protein